MKIAEEFNIEKRGSTHVSNNTIVSDGYDVKEVEDALSLEALQDYLGTDEEDREVLWGRLVDKVEGREEIVVSSQDLNDFVVSSGVTTTTTEGSSTYIDNFSSDSDSSVRVMENAVEPETPTHPTEEPPVEKSEVKLPDAELKASNKKAK